MATSSPDAQYSQVDQNKEDSSSEQDHQTQPKPKKKRADCSQEEEYKAPQRQNHNSGSIESYKEPTCAHLNFIKLGREYHHCGVVLPS